MESARRFFVTGRVQGVFFRASTRAQALRLGLVGWAINLPDGRVEVLAAGSSGALGELAEWLADGPPAAKVTSLEESPADLAELSNCSGFRCG